MKIVGWDIGGANLKASIINFKNYKIKSNQIYCPIWLNIENLRKSIICIKNNFGHCDYHAVTMTAELVDVFKNISDNVNIILVSTKMDIQDKDKIITQNQSRTYANNRKLKFMNVSAKNNINIEECFNYLISKMALLDRQQENNIKLKEKTYVQNMNMCKC